jgi:hypothetical protein
MDLEAGDLVTAVARVVPDDTAEGGGGDEEGDEGGPEGAAEMASEE